jgi:hypothetical protein
VTSLLRALFNEDCVAHIRKVSPVWKTLEHCWINFSHFTEDIIDEQAFSSFEQEGLFGAYLRGRAIQCKRGQCGLDLVIPMVVLPHGLVSPVDVNHISAIIIQVKNRRDDSGKFTESFIKEAKFDMRQFVGLKEPSVSHPYIGVWMSLRSDTVDFTIEGRDMPQVFRRTRTLSNKYKTHFL